MRVNPLKTLKKHLEKLGYEAYSRNNSYFVKICDKHLL